MSQKIKTILVDDESANLKSLAARLVQYFPQLEIVDTIQKPETALKVLDQTPIDLLFLDIAMPRINGLELLSRLEKLSFQVIFVTAYSEYALDAFKQAAIAYILKPIDDQELQQAVRRAIGVIEEKKQAANNEKLLGVLTQNLITKNRIAVPTANGLSFVPKDNILHLEAYEDHAKIHLIDNQTLSSTYHLGKFEKLLDPHFFKCHTAHIINLQKIRTYEKHGIVVLENGSRVPVSKTQKNALLQLFDAL